MKILLSAALLLVVSPDGRAAVTITISPGVSGTRFSVTQTSPNPSIVLGPTTTGFVAGIVLAPGAFTQNPGSVGFVDTFSPRLGVLTNLNGGATGSLVGFSFFFDSDVGAYRPFIGLDSAINLGASQSHQIEFASGMTSEVGLDFSHFITGTYVFSDLIFGEVTTVVIPEPHTVLLASLGCGLVLSRRRRINSEQSKV
jgi:hypothetical protein